MQSPFLADDAFLADVRHAATLPNPFHIWWLAQSGFLVQWQGRHLLFDPYLSESLTKKYATTDKPHIRMTGRVVDPERLEFVDVVTSSHNHTDHLDHETLWPLMRANPSIEILVPASNRQFAAERLKVDPARLHVVDVGGSIALHDFTFHPIPAAHEVLETDQQGRHRYVGYIVKFGPWTLYHSGDCVPFDGLEDYLKPWNVDVAMLPINGRVPARRVQGNFWGREAIALAKATGIKTAIPCHYDLFQHNTEPPDEFIASAKALGQGYCVLRNGERYSHPQA